MNISLEGKVAVLTGASKGIGLAIAEAMAAAGAKVVVSSRKQDAVDAAAAGIRGKGGDAIGVECHVGKADHRERLVEQTVEKFGGLDILVNNAVVNPAFGPIQQMGEGVFDKIMDVNVKAPFELAKLAHPHLEKSGKGSILNIASIEGITPARFMGLYAVSKAALISLTKVMAREWGPDVRANALAPGLVETKFSEVLVSNDDIVNEVIGHQPIPRVAQPAEMTGLSVFLASDAASYCTGAVYLIDGGHCI
jgi:NAD(P)-dependent dehydrogenase (short-subunit alcohol dehydrogenase family)